MKLEQKLIGELESISNLKLKKFTKDLAKEFIKNGYFVFRSIESGQITNVITC